MGFDSIQFEFKEFDPGHEIRTLIQSVGEKLHLNAPSDAAIKFAVRSGKGAVQASCRIASQAGTFVAEAMSSNPIQAVQKIEKKIRRQLDHWKQSRFNDSTQSGCVNNRSE